MPETTFPRTFDAVRPALSNDEIPKLDVRLLVPPFAFNSSISTSGFSSEKLLTLLTSLRDSRYNNDMINLYITLFPHATLSSFEVAYGLVETFQWPHGSKFVLNATVGGPYDGLVSAWQPGRGEPRTSIIIEALKAQPFDSAWYEYLRSAQLSYSHRSNIAAFALQPAKLPTGKSVPDVGAGQDQHVVLYEGTAGVFALVLASSDIWRAFQRWFVAQRADWFLWPVVVGAKDKKDRSWEKFHGTTRAHWTLWFSRFSALHGLYTVYPRVQSLSVLPPRNSSTNVEQSAMKIKFDGTVVADYGASASGEGMDAESLHAIVALGKKNGGVVSLTVVNEAFLETARSWICNVDVAGIRPPGVVWITTDDVAYAGLKDVNGSYAVRMHGMKGGVSGNSYGTPGYWLLMLERTRLIRELLDGGVSVFAFETDQVWLRDPLPFVRRVVNSGDEVDIVGTLDTRHEIGGNFLFLNPTLATQRVWHEVYRRFTKAYSKALMHRRSATSRRYIENDQSTLTKLVLFDVGFKAGSPVVFRALDTDLFVDGRWYDSNRHKYYASQKSQSPIMVNNNFLVGIDNKKNRLIKNRHWFLHGNGTCFEQSVRNAISENEKRGQEAAQKHPEFQEIDLLINGTGSGSRRIEGADIEAGLEEAVAAISKELSSR